MYVYSDLNVSTYIFVYVHNIYTICMQFLYSLAHPLNHSRSLTDWPTDLYAKVLPFSLLVHLPTVRTSILGILTYFPTHEFFAHHSPIPSLHSFLPSSLRFSICSLVCWWIRLGPWDAGLQWRKCSWIGCQFVSGNCTRYATRDPQGKPLRPCQDDLVKFEAKKSQGLCGKSFVLKKPLRPEGEKRGKMEVKDDELDLTKSIFWRLQLWATSIFILDE